MVKYDPQKHHRRSIRFPKYDYSQPGAYYVTIVTWHRECLFGEIIHGKMILNDCGKIAEECWRAIPDHFPHVELGAHVIMPNHVHGIIVITDQRKGAAMLRPYDHHNIHKINVKPGSLGAIVRSTNPRFLTASTGNITQHRSGSAIIMNISSAMRQICKTKQITSKPIQFCGMRMTKIQIT